MYSIDICVSSNYYYESESIDNLNIILDKLELLHDINVCYYRTKRGKYKYVIEGETKKNYIKAVLLLVYFCSEHTEYYIELLGSFTSEDQISGLNNTLIKFEGGVCGNIIDSTIVNIYKDIGDMNSAELIITYILYNFDNISDIYITLERL